MALQINFFIRLPEHRTYISHIVSNKTSTDRRKRALRCQKPLFLSDTVSFYFDPRTAASWSGESGSCPPVGVKARPDSITRRMATSRLVT